MKQPVGSTAPGRGGCWYCGSVAPIVRTGERTDSLVLDREFDTFVHPSCIREALIEDPDDPEANIMKYLLRE